jgi:NAD(P)-dependent dehydrogenase (short-subunit alcohol dehydrogenase family)
VDISDRVILVTGGARGIGAALAHRFATEKPRGIVVSDIDATAAESVAERLRATGAAAVAVAADVARKDQVENLVSVAENAFGPVGLLCSNAGIATGMGIHAPRSVWENAWSVNVLGHLHLAQAVIPGMARRKTGQIVITASAAGLLGLPGDAPYSVTKNAAVALAEWLAVTYGHLGIEVRALCPLGVRTGLLTDGLQARHRAARAVAEAAEILEPEAVADSVVAGLAGDSFFIFPHREVATLHAAKAADPDAWIRRHSPARPSRA